MEYEPVDNRGVVEVDEDSGCLRVRAFGYPKFNVGDRLALCIEDEGSRNFIVVGLEPDILVLKMDV